MTTSEKLALDDIIPVESDEPSAPRVQYADDVELGLRRSRLTRNKSSESLSVKSLRRRSVDPGTLIPIEYRTVSFGVDEAQTQLAKLQSDTKELKASPKGLGVEQDFARLDWHTVSVDEVFRRLSTGTAQGLSAEQVARKTREYGRNVMSSPPSRWLVKTLIYLFGGFGSILFTGSVLVFIAWKPLGDPPALANQALGIVLALVWLIQAAFSFWQDWSTSRVMASIKNMLPGECLVTRDGLQQTISSADLVPGDIISIRSGDKLAADVRFARVTTDLKLDRAVLTGESVPVRGSTDSTESNFLETGCIGMAGTHCVVGNATGVVILTGDNSVFGRLAKLTSAPNIGLTNLEREIYYFVIAIALVMLTMIIVVIIIWAAWLRKEHPGFINVPTLIVNCVSIAIAFIPEGLPIAVTASLTITAGIMKRNKILCKSLKTVETLGSVSTICSDKTGTLTKNRMTVTDFIVGKTQASTRDLVKLLGVGIDTTEGKYLFNNVEELATLCGLCNDGEFDATESKLPAEERKVFGNVTDQAILRFAEKIQSIAEIRMSWKSLFKVPFNSKIKFMVNVVQRVRDRIEGDETPLSDPSLSTCLTVKGGPDIILPKCTYYLDPFGKTVPLTDDHRNYIEQVKDDWSTQAKRVILVARKYLGNKLVGLSSDSSQYEEMVMQQSGSGLELVGLVGIVDPIRDEIPQVVNTLRGAGVKIHMVTGDFKLTAQAIARDCGIITSSSVHDTSHLNEDTKERSSIVLSGPDMMTLDDEQWDFLCEYQEIVFARTTPEQKLRIVKELQKRDEVVGMTGDGVNDAPSLKAADIGIAMGSGSDVAIEAADMVLLDSFAAIIEALRYGRVVFDNLKKTICYLLPAGSFSEFWPVMTFVAFGMPQILSSFLMIIICCFTDCAAAVALAYEKPESDVLLRKPRNVKKDHLVNWQLILFAYGFIGVLETVCSFAMAYWYTQRKGIDFGNFWFGFGAIPEGMSSDQYNAILNTASSIYFVNLVVMQWCTLMAVRLRRQSNLTEPPILRKMSSNYYLFPAILFSFVVAIIFLYPKKLNDVLDTSQVPAAHWFIPLGFGTAIVLIDEIRRYGVRRYPKSILAKMAW